MGERTTVIGTILAVVFQNEENGYTVARIVTDDGEPVTVVGWHPLRRARRGADPDRTLHDASRSTASSLPPTRWSGICRRARRRS